MRRIKVTDARCVVIQAEKMASESSFLAVLLRMMILLLPSLNLVSQSDPRVAARFSTMATIILEFCGSHSAVIVEGMAFFEVLAMQQSLLPKPSSNVNYSENPLLSSIPFLLNNVAPDRHEIYSVERRHRGKGCLSSKLGVRGSVIDR